MVPGHTKFKCDGSFGLIKKLYRKTTVDCVNHIVEVVKRSSTAGLNKAQCYENGKGFQYLDLNSVLGIVFKKLSGLQKYQHFLFEAARPGVVKARLVANGAFTEFNLLKTKKASVPEITNEIKSFIHFNTNSSTHGLQKVRVSYQNIRAFARDEFKDITCPQPIYTDNE